MLKKISILVLLILFVVMAVDGPQESAVLIEKNAPELMLVEQGVFDWQTWEKEPSEFVWQFSETEKAYVLAGKVFIKADGSDKVYVLEKGDFVTFAPGLRTYWHVVEPFKKHVTLEQNLLQKVYWKLAFKVQSVVRFCKDSIF